MKRLLLWLSAFQGGSEQRTKASKQYSEGAAQLLTSKRARSSGGVWSFASKQATAAQEQKGYTIVEVMVVLSVTAVLFTSSVLIFQGQQGKTQLSQSLYNTASQVQSYASEVSSGVYPTTQNGGVCLLNSGKPYIGAGTAGQSNCIFLGRAVQVTNSNTLVAYPVLGARTPDGKTNNTSFDTANPEPAVDSSGNFTTGLEEQFTLPSGEKFSKSTVWDNSGSSLANAYMIGLYQDVSGGNFTSALNIRGYNLPAATTPKTLNVKLCVEQKSPCTSRLLNIRRWELCITSGSRTGSVMVTTTSNGVASTVNAGACI